MLRNSTIRAKQGNCSHPGCTYYGPLTKGKCHNHYWSDIRMKSVARLEEKEISQNESLSTVLEDLDLIFSQFIRLRDSDENGYVTCPCCGSVNYWTECDNMHFIPRIHKNTRYSEENCYGGCRSCNQLKDGNIAAFGAFIERLRPGGVDLLEEQARVAYSFTVWEIKSLISHYSKEVNRMKKTKPLKI